MHTFDGTGPRSGLRFNVTFRSLYLLLLCLLLRFSLFLPPFGKKCRSGPCVIKPPLTPRWLGSQEKKEFIMGSNEMMANTYLI